MSKSRFGNPSTFGWLAHTDMNQTHGLRSSVCLSNIRVRKPVFSAMKRPKIRRIETALLPERLNLVTPPPANLPRLGSDRSIDSARRRIVATRHSERQQTVRIAVLAGGESRERNISLESGDAVAKALSERGHIVTRIDPAQIDLATLDWSGFDVVFLALHGTFGEDGHTQQILEELGIPFTGSDSNVSRLAFSKSAAKERFVQNGVPTPSYVLIHVSDCASRIQQQALALGFPLVVKPDAQGSSLGVTIVRTPEELPQALARCFHFDAFGLIETAIDGTEWTLGMLDDMPLPLIQIETGRGFFDYTAKYEDDETQYLFEFAVPTNVVKAVESAGRRAGEALGVRGLARADLRVDRFGQPWVLEVNTIPGMTSHSLVPKAAARMGLSLGALCERAIENCLTRQAREGSVR
jgi:D-alanine-D-alanine ligase